MNDVSDRLVKIFAAIFPELTPEEIRVASPASVAAWNSLATINLVSLVEEEFGIDIPPDRFEDLGSFELVLEYLSEAAPA
ncbi:MAG TPA: acyl carrier protein [Steroidobacteraceae bacterium]|nr:acyl carrier protein [Steroidobacteraceae bacterium]